nr:NACHT domain-containing protein [Amycolatopsis aidingensis]
MQRRRARFERAASLTELAEAELASPLQRRKLENLLDRIGNQVTEQLEPVLHEFSGDLPENEAAAAVLAVLDVLGEADLTDEALLADDADAEQLARRLRGQFPDRARQVSLAERARPLYELALDQACRHLVQVIRYLPAFRSTALAEVLARLTTQSERLDELLARLPRTSLFAPQGTDLDVAFRGRYLECLAARLDRLELLGLPMDEQPALPLTVAYLSLRVSTENDRPRDRRIAAEWFESTGTAHHTDGVPVENAIGDSQRTLLRGDAGSGKTTLLHWLAVTAARHGFTGALAEWNGCVPFLIQLRSFSAGDLPAPEEFVPHAAKAIAGAMPEGWVHRRLEDGTALLLVDGVDEVPAARRREVKAWLRDLVGTFPGMRVVVTSRTAAADRRWLAEEEFATVTLEPMSPRNVLTFVERWHEAASGTHVAEAAEAQRRLRGQLERPHLRELAATPLLCAMLCALNLAHRSELPRNRMDLYDKALAMLLHLRDAERGISGLLTDTEKKVLLRDLAWRLTLANRVELTRDNTLVHLRQKLPGMPNVDAEPEALLNHLLERSGVLREPVPGKVDFVHRTFQEYLAADEAVQQHHIDTLVAHAHLDTWRETVVMACGHATARQAAQLLGGILDRAEENRPHARRLRLLAAACLETVQDVEPAVRSRVDGLVERHLVPPRNVRETRSLASIGHRVLRHLPTDLSELSEAKAVATARTVALTCSSEALPRLARYAQDPRPSVQYQIADAWQYFDPERFAEEVLADSPLAHGHLIVHSRRLLPFTGRLRRLRSLWIMLPQREPLDDLESLSDQEHVTNINVHLNPGRTVSLAALEAHRRIEYLILRDAAEITDTSVLSKLDNLISLILAPTHPWQDISFVSTTRNLDLLSLGSLVRVSDYNILSELRKLRLLELSEYTEEALHRTRPLPHISEINLYDPVCRHDVGKLSGTFPGIRRLRLIDYGQFDLTELPAWPLNELVLSGTTVPDLTPLTRFPLHTVRLVRFPGTVDLSPLAELDIRLRLDRKGHYRGLRKLGPGVKIKYVD